MFKTLNKVALDWISSNLKPFIQLLEKSLDLKTQSFKTCFWIDFWEFVYILIEI